MPNQKERWPKTVEGKEFTMERYIERVVDLTEVAGNRIYNMSVEEAR